MGNRVVISVAHTVQKRGASGGGFHEWEWSQEFSCMLRECIGDGARTVLIDTPNWTLDQKLIAACRPYRELVEPHLNWARDSRTNYGVILRSDTRRAARVAIEISDAMESILCWRFLGSRGWRGGFPRSRRLLETASPALILEPGFISNPRARSVLFDPETMKELAKAVAGCLQ